MPQGATRDNIVVDSIAPEGRKDCTGMNDYGSNEHRRRISYLKFMLTRALQRLQNLSAECFDGVQTDLSFSRWRWLVRSSLITLLLRRRHAHAVAMPSPAAIALQSVRRKYEAVDIPPALWVAERYLSGLFPERHIFPYRDFQRFEEIAESYARADLVFLLSSQLGALPPDSIDLIINISSLHEMRKDQIDHYFRLFDRVLKPGGPAYIKEWKKGEDLVRKHDVHRKRLSVPKEMEEDHEQDGASANTLF
jgi:SAM-dependent methyltransferase